MTIKIVIDPGHGGSETGAVANGYVEKDLNLSVSLFLEKELQRCGFETITTRTTDVNPSLTERGQVALNAKANSLVSIHFNAYTPSAFGTEMIYSFHKDAQASSKWIADCIIDEVVKLGVRRRGVWTKESDNNKGRNWYGVLRSCEPIPSVIVEGLFLTNLKDIELLKDPNFLKNLAIACAKGLCKAYAIPYVEEVVVPVKPEINTIEDACLFLKDRAFSDSDGWLKKAKSNQGLADIFIVLAKNWDTIKNVEFMDIILQNVIKNRGK